MILVYPLLLIAAGVAIWRGEQPRWAGWQGFAVWTAAGALFTFSLLTGFSIGLFLLPLVVAGMYIAVRLAPDFTTSLGFVVGAGAVLLVLLAAL